MMFLLEIVRLGLANLQRHKLRSFLTALGIILGVAAVITNASIGEGSKRDALLQLERLGATNIIIRSTKPPESANAGSGRRSWTSRYGLTRDDLAVLRSEFPDMSAIVPLKSVGGQILRNELRRTSQAFGTTPELASTINLRLARGRYLTQGDIDERTKVAVIGAEVARTMFPFDDPLGETVRIDAQAFEIVGILEPVGIAGGAGAKLVGRDLNFDLHIPLSTAEEVFGDTTFRASSGSQQSESVQVSELYMLSPSRDEVMPYAALIKRVLESRRPGLPDVTMVIPLELLEEAKRTARTWNLILTSIAGISLLVGGIGIMNIMLASVTERTREIGIRRALGATRRHIIYQFVVETGVLSTVGGLVGVTVGVGLSLGLEGIVPELHKFWLIGDYFSESLKLPTSVTPWSIFTAFAVATLTGLIFGIYPAFRAAAQDPIVALRHD